MTALHHTRLKYYYRHDLMHAPFSKLNEKCFFFWNAFWLIWNRDCGKISLHKKKHDTFQQELMERNIDSRALDSTVWQMDRVRLTWWLTARLLHSDICSYRLPKNTAFHLAIMFFRKFDRVQSFHTVHHMLPLSQHRNHSKVFDITQRVINSYLSIKSIWCFVI